MAPRATAAIIRARTRQLCGAADLETFTAKKLKQQLAAEFDAQTVTKYESAIRKELDAFIEQQAEAVATEDGGEDAAATAAPAARQKRKPAEPAAAEAGTGTASSGAKRAKAGDGSAAPAGSEDAPALVLTLAARRKLAVRAFKGSVLVDLREFFMDKESGEERPSDRGVALTPAQWQLLLPELPGLAELLAAEDTTQAPVELGALRRAYVSLYQGRLSVQVREFYTDSSGELKATKKGLGLDAEALARLQQNSPAINAAVAKLAATTPASAGGEPTGTARRAPAAAAGPSSSQPASAAPGAAPSGAAVTAIELGGSKRVTASTFTGATTVDLREWYTKDGAQLPGKKGISLKLAEWRLLMDHLEAISQAVTSRDGSYCLHLTPKRRVSLNEFKGKWYVGVREFYTDKQGKEAPGAKGCSMALEQWQTLATQAAAFTATLP